MTWYVKARDTEGAVYSILCDEPAQVLENLAEQRIMGRDAWIEDTSGKIINESILSGSKQKDA